MAFPELTMEQIEAADDLGIKLEITEGLPTWEFHPTHLHQKVELAMIRSIRPRKEGKDCACYPLHDVLIAFPGGSIKRPDIAIFCKVPTEMTEAIRQIPGAVIEIISADSARKDLELNPPFYLKHGVLDVIVVNPLTHEIAWFTKEGRRDLKAPQTAELQCGCVVDI
jgi:Uma2 family endonuclease